MGEAFVVTAGSVPAPLNVIGEQVTVLAGGDQTGSYEIFLQQGAEGIGPPVHCHPWDEAYYVLAGMLRVTLGDSARDLRAGDFVHIPAGSFHTYAGIGGAARFLTITSTLGATRFFRDLDREVPTLPPDVPAMLAVADRHQVRVPPPKA